MSDGFVASFALVVGTAILILIGTTATMFWLAWVSEHFSLLAPIGFTDSGFGFITTSVIVAALFGAGNRS